MSEAKAWLAEDQIEEELRATLGERPQIIGMPSPYRRETREIMWGQSIFWQGELGRSMFDYLNLSMPEIVRCENPIIRAIGMLDRRLGKRRLRELSMESEHPLVKRLHAFRCECEGIGPRE